jgi:4-hydroxy-tetrahydrodipicolinate synthase
MTDRLKLEGAFTAIVTPFANGEVDWDTFGKLIDRQLEGGVSGIVPCGTTGESPTLNNDEHDKVIEFTVEKVAGRGTVIAGTGSNSTVEAIERTEHAKKAGADACLIVNPYYNKPPQRGMFQHIQEIAGIDLPIVLYNIPGRTGIKLEAETICRMYDEIEQVVAVKDAVGDLDMTSAVAANSDITILSGDDSLTLPMGSVGGSGVVSVLSNILPAEVSKLTRHILDGDMAAACTQHLKLFPLFRGMFAETNPVPIKAALAMAGLIRNELRLPLVPLADEHRPALAKLLSEFGIEAKA